MGVYITAAGCCREDLGYGAKKPKACKHDSFYITLAAYEKQNTTRGGDASAGRSDATTPSAVVAGAELRGLGFGPAKSRRKPKKRSERPRDWTLAIAKKEEEGDVCRVCGAPGTECAHILGRKFDQPVSPGARTLLVLPDRIVPLCGEFANRCHQRYDAKELDLLPYLTAAEQAQAVLDAGSMGLALTRISPTLELAA